MIVIFKYFSQYVLKSRGSKTMISFLSFDCCELPRVVENLVHYYYLQCTNDNLKLHEGRVWLNVLKKIKWHVHKIKSSSTVELITKGCF